MVVQVAGIEAVLYSVSTKYIISMGTPENVNLQMVRVLKKISKPQEMPQGRSVIRNKG
jgi:hypothetical protein